MIAPQPCRIGISLSVGDALTFPADLAVIGGGPVLIERVQSMSGARFEKFDYPDYMRKRHPRLNGIRTSRFLRSPDFLWRHTLSIEARPNQRPRRRLQSEIGDALTTAVRAFVRPRSILWVPYHSRNADTVAKNMLYHLWLLHSQTTRGLGPRHSPTTIRIVDRKSVDLFHTLITDGADELRDFMLAQMRSNWSLDETRLDRYPPSFFLV